VDETEPAERGERLRAKQGSRRQTIIDQAARLMQEKGFAGTSIQDVADQLDFTKAAFYYYVKNKDELLYQITVESLRLAGESIAKIAQGSEPPDAKLRAVINTYVHLVAEQPEFFTVYFHDKGSLQPEHLESVNEMERLIVDSIRSIYEEGVAAGQLRDLDPRAVVFGLLGMCCWIYKWYRTEGDLTVEQLSAVFQELAGRGFLAQS
jgi:AcrR family transcriptional regulator